MTTQINPVRAIKHAAYGNLIVVKNALYREGYNTYKCRHQSLNSLLGSMPKQILERVLARVLLGKK